MYCPNCGNYNSPKTSLLRISCINCKKVFEVIEKPPFTLQMILDMCKNGEYIKAIKEVRLDLDCGLLVAKKIVDLISNSENISSCEIIYKSTEKGYK